MTSQQLGEIPRRINQEVVTQGQLDVVDELFASDFVGHFYPHEVHGPEGIKDEATTLRTAFPDLEMTAEHVIGDGSYDATRWRAHGTHEGEFQGIPPTGRQAEWTGIGIHRYQDGKMIEAWENRDRLGLLTQLGVIDMP